MGKKTSKLFGVTKEPYKKIYHFLGLKWTRNYPMLEMRDLFREEQKKNESLQNEIDLLKKGLFSVKDSTPQENILNEIDLLKKGLVSVKDLALKRTVPRNFIINDGDNNKIVIVKENGESVVNPPQIPGVNIRMIGSNNTITIYEPFHFDNVTFILSGDITVIINKNCTFGKGCLIKKTKSASPNKLIIGEDFFCGPNCTFDLTFAGDIIIEDGVKWSWNIYLKSDDTHAVFDTTSKKCLNPSDAIMIGKNVWIGMNVTILKNSVIKENSIIGACSVITKKFDEGNVVIAGNPAQIRKTNVNWSPRSVQDYIRLQNEGKI